MTEPPSIRVDGLTRAFDDLLAVEGLSFEVPPGTVFGFLGPNGAGKTTTIRLLLGLLEPTAGHAEVLGMDPWTRGDDVRRRVGSLLETHGLYGRLTARENLAFHARLHGLAGEERARRISRRLEEFELSERASDRVDTFSKGMKRRLALARALLSRPDLLVLDEPTASLDVMASRLVRSLIAQQGQRGVTAFLTTHDLHEAAELCDLVAVCREGRLLAIAPPDELRESGPSAEWVTLVGGGFPRRMSQRIGQLEGVLDYRVEPEGLRVQVAPGGSVARIVEVAIEAGADLDEVRRDRPSLEEAFVSLVRGEE